MHIWLIFKDNDALRFGKQSLNIPLHLMNTHSEALCCIAATAANRGREGPFQRILVADDDMDIRQLSAEVLIRSGYQVDAAEDGAAAWEALHANSYHLLITDHNMPRLSGLELVEKLRAARMTLPVILASGTMNVEDLNNRNPSLRLAATLAKPFSIDQLVETVQEVLGAANRAGGQIEPLPNWRSQPSAVGLRL
jgi:DNA-binding response OmpR family regulator